MFKRPYLSCSHSVSTPARTYYKIIVTNKTDKTLNIGIHQTKKINTIYYATVPSGQTVNFLGNDFRYTIDIPTIVYGLSNTNDVKEFSVCGAPKENQNESWDIEFTSVGPIFNNTNGKLQGYVCNTQHPLTTLNWGSVLLNTDSEPPFEQRY